MNPNNNGPRCERHGCWYAGEWVEWTDDDAFYPWGEPR